MTPLGVQLVRKRFKNLNLKGRTNLKERFFWNLINALKNGDYDHHLYYTYPDGSIGIGRTKQHEDFFDMFLKIKDLLNKKDINGRLGVLTKAAIPSVQALGKEMAKLTARDQIPFWMTQMQDIPSQIVDLLHISPTGHFRTFNVATFHLEILMNLVKRSEATYEEC